MGKREKHILDAILSVLLIVCMGYQVTGNLFHEITGTFLFVLFILHCILNGHWFINFMKIPESIKGNFAAVISYVTNILLIADMSVLAVTSVLISHNVFSFIGLYAGNFTRWLHIASAYAGLILVSVHVGCHWKSLLIQMYNAYGINMDNKPARITGRIVALVVAVSGIYSSFEQSIGSKFIYNPEPDAVQPSGTVPGGAQETVPPESRNGSGYGHKGGRHGIDSSASNNIQDLQYNVESKSILQELELTGKGYKEDSLPRNFTENIKEGESLEDFLGRLVCTGCGKQCPLISPQCSTGRTQAQQASDYYNGSVAGNDLQGDYGSNVEDSKSTILKSSKKKITISGDDNITDLFAGYIPVAGLYIAGTYYALEVINIHKRKKKEDEEKNEIMVISRNK